MQDPEETRRALEVFTDQPRWIEARGLLLSGRAGIFFEGDAWILRNNAPGGQLAVARGEPSAELLRRALTEPGAGELLCGPEEADHIARSLPNWEREEAQLFALEDPNTLAPPSANARLLEAHDDLSHLAEELRAEITGTRVEREVWCAFDEGRAASFAYSYWRTEGQFDISIDTAAQYRRRGLARVAVSELIRHEWERGLRPVWGAMSRNTASIELARNLGFAPVDKLVLFSRPGA